MTSPKRYTICTTSGIGVVNTPHALLFETVGPLACETLSLAPDIHVLLPTSYFVTPAQVNDRAYGTLVCGYKYLPFPDAVPLEAPPLWYCYMGTACTLDLRRCYTECLSFFKTVGCRHCPDRYKRCIQRIITASIQHNNVPVPYQIGLPRLGSLDGIDFRFRFPTLAGHTYISPRLTTEAGCYTETSWRPYWQHTFYHVEA